MGGYARVTIRRVHDSGSVSVESYQNDEDFRVCWGYTTDHAGPTLLHALVAAAKEVGK